MIVSSGRSQMMVRPATAHAGLRQLALLPLVFAGAMLYWTLALGLGACSLMGLGALSADTTIEFVGVDPTGVEPMPGVAASTDHITVQIQESAEPEDVNDNAGAGSLRAPSAE